MSAPICPSCRQPMDEGFVVDHGDHGRAAQEQWVSGTPMKSFWTGLKTSGEGIKRLAVTTFRCPKCGRLESFATE